MNKSITSLFIATVAMIATVMPTSVQAALYVTIVQGLGGMPEFDSAFTDQAGKIREASLTLAEESQVTSLTGDSATRDALLSHFQTLAAAMTDDDRVAIYLVGHGSYDGEQYKFNIPGPDITDTDLADIMDSFPGQNHFLVNTSSTSGAILEGA